MRHADRWEPTKYVLVRGRLRASRDAAHVGVGSRLVADAVAARYQSHVPRHVRGRLADLGCGTVPLHGLYRPHVDEVVCIDWPQSPHVVSHLDVAADLNRPLPIADAAFDTVILSDVLEHVAEPALLWREMARVMRPGACLLLNVPFLYGVHEAPHDYYRYTRHALERHAVQSGFEVVLVEPVGGSVSVMADLAAKHLAQVPAIGRAMAALCQALAGAFARTGLGRRIEARTGERFPLGYFMVCRRAA